MKSRRGLRILSLLFAALLLLSACAGQGNAPSDTAGTQPTGESDAAPDAVSETGDGALYHDGVPALDFKGDTLTFSVSTGLSYEIYVEDSVGEVTNDAVYDRNKMMEDRFRVKIAVTAVNNESLTEQPTFIRQSMAAGENSFDVAAIAVYYVGALLLDDLFFEWGSIPYADLDNPWWVKRINDTFTINGKLYSAVSDLCVTTVQYTYAYLFNQELATDYHVENLYDAVDEGRWTLDCMYEIIKDFYVDTNGDGARDEGDVYGLVTDLNTSLESYLPGCDQKILSLTDDGLKIMLGDEKALEIYEKVRKIFNESSGVFSIFHGSKGYVYNDKYRLFKNDSGLLMPVRMYALGTDLSDMASDYGIIPFPKYDETQEEYLTSCQDSFSTLCVPNIAENLEMIGALIEAMSCESRNSVMPAFFESALQHRYSRDSRSAHMLDVIMNGRTYDLASLFIADAGRIKYFFSETLRDNKPYVSAYEAKIGAYETAVEQLNLKLSALGNPDAADTENQ